MNSIGVSTLMLKDLGYHLTCLLLVLIGRAG